MPWAWPNRGATLGGHSIGKLPGDQFLDLSALVHFIDYDIANNSWGVSPPFLPVNIEGDYSNAVRFGRSGLGTVVVTAGGNDRADGGNANSDRFSNNRYSIQVGAINAVTDLGLLQIGQAPFSIPAPACLYRLRLQRDEHQPPDRKRAGTCSARTLTQRRAPASRPRSFRAWSP